MAKYTRVLRRLAFLVHALGAGAALYFMAGGFPLSHLHFLANRGLPFVVLVMSLAAIYADRVANKTLLHALTVSMASGWLVAALTGRALFPISSRYLLPVGVVVSVILFLLRFKRSDLSPRGFRLTSALVVPGIVIGFLVPLTQRSALPTTRPIAGGLPAAPSEPGRTVPVGLPLKTLRVATYNGGITFTRGRLVLMIDPLLTFVSRSPDRCWILFAPRYPHEPPVRTLTAWSRGESSLHLRYADLGTRDLRVRTVDDDTTEIEATSEVPEATYSHLNSFCDIVVYGHTKLSLAFSPCPDRPVDVLPMDYPVGRPLRFAYLDAAGVFRVAEASSGEKGPFHDLSTGPLDRREPLAITLLDEGRPFATIALADWAAQLSTDLSPTAGWGVPQNAIEFSLADESARSAAGLYLSLAATSVARGFDSVGHAPGVYRNRITVRLIGP